MIVADRPGLEGCAVVELRQYTLRPDMRDDLVRLFEARLTESQEEAGIVLGGTYLDRAHADRFVWMRGWPDLEARGRSLRAFYDGPVWAAHRAAANRTMLDSDDVLMLRPTSPSHPPPSAGPRPPVGAAARRHEHVVVVVDHVPAERNLLGWLAGVAHGVVERALQTPVATWQTEPAPNNFPRLPVRRAHVFTWLAAFPDTSAYLAGRRRLVADPQWRGEVRPRLSAVVWQRQILHLEPTPRCRPPVRTTPQHPAGTP